MTANYGLSSVQRYCRHRAKLKVTANVQTTQERTPTKDHGQNVCTNSVTQKVTSVNQVPLTPISSPFWCGRVSLGIFRILVLFSISSKLKWVLGLGGLLTLEYHTLKNSYDLEVYVYLAGRPRASWAVAAISIFNCLPDHLHFIVYRCLKYSFD
jgi:hypothetical protein